MALEAWDIGVESDVYAAATGRIRVLEMSFIARKEFEDAISHFSASENAHFLDVHHYPEGSTFLDRLSKKVAYDEAMIWELSSHPFIPYMIFLDKIYHNLKVMVKYVISGAVDYGNHETDLPQSISSLLYNIKNIDNVKIYKLVCETVIAHDTPLYNPAVWKDWDEEYSGFSSYIPGAYVSSDLPKVMSDAISMAVVSYEKSGMAGSIDLTIDKYYYSHLSSLAHHSGIPAFITYSSILSDIANLNILYRSKLMKIPVEYALSAFVYGGKTGRYEFASLYTSNKITEWKARFSSNLGDEIVGVAFSKVWDNDDFINSDSDFMKAKDTLIMEFARECSNVLYGPQVVLGYYLATQMEIRNLKLLYYLKSRGLTDIHIKKKLREVFINA